MKETDWRNTLEVIVKGLVAVVVGLAGLYILGWVLSLLGGILLGLAGIIVALLRWLVPVAIIVGIVYFAVTQLQGKSVQAAQPVTPPPAPAYLENEVAEKMVDLKVEAQAEVVAAQTESEVVTTQTEIVAESKPEEPKSKPAKASKAKATETSPEDTPTEDNKDA